ncbi:MAG: pilus assembly protein TadB, partial [Microbacterium sp.]
PGTPGMHAELIAIALSGGASITRARVLVGQDTATVDDARRDDIRRTDVVLELSRSAGVPAGDLLRASAAQQRHDARVRGRVAAARLSAQMLLPLGACTLPAFLLLGVAPLMLSVLASTPLPM